MFTIAVIDRGHIRMSIYPKNPYYDALCIDLIHSVHDKTDKQTENYYEIISLDDEKNL